MRLGALFGGPVLAAVLLSTGRCRSPRRARARPSSPPLAGRLVLHRGPRRHDGRQPLLAVHRQRHPDRPLGRRPLDQRRLLPARLALADRRTAGEGPGSRCPRRRTTGSRPTWRRSSSSPAAGCASSTPPATTSSTRKAPSPTAATNAGCATTRSPSSPSRRPPRLLLGRRAPPHPHRPLLPPTLPRQPLAHLRSGANRSPWSPPLGPGRASAVSVGHEGFALDVTRPGKFLVRVNFTPYWSIGSGTGCLLRDGNWTIARIAHTGIFSVDADFSLGGAWNAMTGAKKTC